ncbi:hypothetical protein BH11PSE8_BH11PSE8_30340 [soil metagenome]
MTGSIKPRLKPSQSRAWMTSISIQDAFLQLLLEKDFESISMRDIANVSGVSIGGLYRYFPSKEAIAAMTIHTWVRRLASALALEADTVNRTLDATVHACVQVHVATMLDGSDKWRALSSLERRISPQAVYNHSYMHNVRLFGRALTGASDWPAGRPGEHEAFNAYTMVDAIVKQTLIVRPTCPSESALVADIVCAVLGYLRVALAVPGQAG